MKKEFLICITGTQRVDNDDDVVELVTTGDFSRKNGKFYISYDESEATGFINTRTTLMVEDNKRVTLTRTGENGSQLIVEKGVRHQCSYDTGEGTLLIGVLGAKINSTLTKNGGDLAFSYSLDINTSLASENEVHIIVKECSSKDV